MTPSCAAALMKPVFLIGREPTCVQLSPPSLEAMTGDGDISDRMKARKRVPVQTMLENLSAPSQATRSQFVPPSTARVSIRNSRSAFPSSHQYKNVPLPPAVPILLLTEPPNRELKHG